MNAAPAAPAAARALRWVHRNFLDGWHNVVLAGLCLWLLAATLPPIWRWAVTNSRVAPADYNACLAAGGACWAYLQAKWRLILFGTYPYDEQWRPALAIGVFLAAVLVSCLPGVWAGARRRGVMLVLWAATIAAIVVLMPGGVLGLAPVEHRLWSGLPLTMGLAVVGCVGAFGIAILLALGRRSEMPLVHGERIVICGPSGSGKSTLIRCINRLEEHQQGTIVVDGIELTDDVKNDRRGAREVGMVFQQFNLFPHLTVLENCTLAPIWVRKMPKKRPRSGDEVPRSACASPSRPTSIPASSPAASSSASRSRARCA
jgi:hypothetical protein